MGPRLKHFSVFWGPYLKNGCTDFYFQRFHKKYQTLSATVVYVAYHLVVDIIHKKLVDEDLEQPQEQKVSFGKLESK